MSTVGNADRWPWPLRLISALSPATRAWLESVSVRVDDSPGWTASTATRWDDPDTASNQIESLEAWRRSPLARRIVSLTTDFVVGDGISLRSKRSHVQGFVTDFWNHPENHMGLRLADMCDELTRTGELFPVLHKQADRMSFVRFVPAADIVGIEWEPGDYEQELEYKEGGLAGMGRASPTQIPTAGLKRPGRDHACYPGLRFTNPNPDCGIETGLHALTDRERLELHQPKSRLRD